MRTAIRPKKRQWHHPQAQIYQLRMKRRPTRGERRFCVALDSALKGFDLPLIKQTQVKKRYDRKPRKFKKQKIFEDGQNKKAYIVDFFIPALDLVLEVDGPNHQTPEQRNYDAIRTGFLATRNIKVVRFTNDETKNEIECIERIKQLIQKREQELLNRPWRIPGTYSKQKQPKPEYINPLSREQELQMQAEFILARTEQTPMTEIIKRSTYEKTSQK